MKICFTWSPLQSSSPHTSTPYGQDDTGSAWIHLQGDNWSRSILSESNVTDQTYCRIRERMQWRRGTDRMRRSHEGRDGTLIMNEADYHRLWFAGKRSNLPWLIQVQRRIIHSLEQVGTFFPSPVLVSSAICPLLAETQKQSRDVHWVISK